MALFIYDFLTMVLDKRLSQLSCWYFLGREKIMKVGPERQKVRVSHDSRGAGRMRCENSEEGQSGQSGSGEVSWRGLGMI